MKQSQKNTSNVFNFSNAGPEIKPKKTQAMLEIEQAKNKRPQRINSARVNLRNESNSVLPGGRKEFNEPVASKRVTGLNKNSNQFSIIGTNVNKEINDHKAFTMSSKKIVQPRHLASS